MYGRILQVLVEAKRNKESGLGNPLGRRGPKPVDGQAKIPTGSKAKSGAPEANKISRVGPSFTSTLSKMPAPGLIGGIPKIGQSQTTDRDVQQALMKARVKKNIAQSAAATASSNYGTFAQNAARRKELADLKGDIEARSAQARQDKVAKLRRNRERRATIKKATKMGADAAQAFAVRVPNITTTPTANAFDVGGERETAMRATAKAISQERQAADKRSRRKVAGTGLVSKLFSTKKSADKSMSNAAPYKS